MELILVVVLCLFLFGGGGWYGYNRWGAQGGMGIVGVVLVLLLIFWFVGGVGFGGGRGLRFNQNSPPAGAYFRLAHLWPTPLNLLHHQVTVAGVLTPR